MAVGTGYQGGTLQTTWGTPSDNTRATGQVNVADSTDNNFYLTGVQLEVGSQATAFEHRSFAEEQTLCERYCQTIMNGADANNSNQHDMAAFAYQADSIFMPTPLRTRMRAAPSVSATTGAFYWKCYFNGTNIYMDGNGLDRESTTTATLFFNTPSGGNISQGTPCFMRTNSSAARILLTSEL